MNILPATPSDDLAGDVFLQELMKEHRALEVSLPARVKRFSFESSHHSKLVVPRRDTNHKVAQGSSCIHYPYPRLTSPTSLTPD